MRKNQLIIQGACQNNLKNINIKIPKNKLVVITGLSGSGKSSLAFDIIYAEGYRRYVENLSSQARFFLNGIKKPKVDKIENLSPTIAIDQRRDTKNPRSTVGTILGVHNFLRTLYAEVGQAYCPNCQIPLEQKNSADIIQHLKKIASGTEVYILAPWYHQGNFQQQLKTIASQGYTKIRLNNKIEYIKDYLNDDQKPTGKIEVVVDRLNIDQKYFDQERIIDSLQIANKLSNKGAIIAIEKEKDFYYSKNYYCSRCNFEMPKLVSKNFSFNSPEGACKKCSGLGEVFQGDINKIIPNEKLSIAEGGLMPWNYFNGNGESKRRKQILQILARRYNFKLTQPINKIPKQALNKILYGDKKEMEIVVDKNKICFIFKGLLTEIEEKYKNKKKSATELDKYLTKTKCSLCQGKRLQKKYLAVRVFDKTIADLTFMEIGDLVKFLKNIKSNQKINSKNTKKELVQRIITEIIFRIQYLKDVGIDYLNLDRSINTLSGGEFQRLRLSTQLQNGLSEIIYILDEPSVGLHSRDVKNLIKTLKKICSQGNNSVIVVEHDRNIIQSADYIIDIGPGAGKKGGKIVFAGKINDLKNKSTETAKYLFSPPTCKYQPIKNKKNKKITIKGAEENNLKNINIDIPLQKMVVVTGVSGSGKSSLIIDVLAKGLKKKLNGVLEMPGKHKQIVGYNQLAKVVIVNQSPIGRSPRSNVATYTGIFRHIREIFAKTDSAKEMGLNEGYFSFNVRGGRCEYCQGEGTQKTEMHLLGDIYTQCPYCEGTRYNEKIRNIEYHGVNIIDVLNMSVEYAYHFFNFHKIITKKLKVLMEVGLGYLKLGQNATELSGGEAQRIKLATELIKQSKRGALYILDEPTVGLHFSDIQKLLKMLRKLTEQGNSVIIVEHNDDIVCASDWVIELGPGGGHKGGKIIYEGFPREFILKSQNSGIINNN